MSEQVLEELHSHGLLVPLFRVDLTPGDPDRRRDASDSLTAQYVTTTYVAELLAAVADGRAADPTTEPFSPWPSDRVRMLWPTNSSGYLYEGRGCVEAEQLVTRVSRRWSLSLETIVSSGAFMKQTGRTRRQRRLFDPGVRWPQRYALWTPTTGRS